MKKSIYFLLLLSFVACKQEEKAKFVYPETKKVEQTDTYFGTTVADPYRWLENDTAKDTESWVKAQNKVTFDYLNGIPFREKIKQRFTELWNYEKRSIPSKYGDKYYFYKNDGLQNQSILYVQDAPDAEARIFFDPNTLSKDGTVALSNTAFSQDGKFFAYSISRSGSDWKEIYVIETLTGKQHDEFLEWVKFSEIAWYKEGFFYSSYEAPKKGTELSSLNENHKIYYHKLGTKQSQDVLIYENPGDPKKIYSAIVSDNQKYLIVAITGDSNGIAVMVKDLSNAKAQFVTLDNSYLYEYELVSDNGDKLLFRTNNQAPMYKLVEIDMKKPELANWKEIVPQRDELLEACYTAKDKLFVKFLKNVYSIIEIYTKAGERVGELQLPSKGTLTNFKGKEKEEFAFYSYTSFTEPEKIFKYSVKDNKSEVYFEPRVDFDQSKYETKLEFYKSKDGTQIPIYITHKKGLELNGNNPALIYGYGGFNVIYPPDFRISRVVWLENGGIYANAHIRGGGEFGQKWHESGTKLQKQNVFDDFIAAAEYLIAQKYTSPQKLAIRGGSNGGLLVGAVTNQRPDLFKVALPAVGVMDMLRYHKFTIGWHWAGDYGSSDNEQEFKYLMNYSPVHTVRENVEYPAVLVTTADHDDRVVPAHSFKYIAVLQEKYKGNNPVMIRIQTDAGHGAGKSTTQQIEEETDIWAFTFFNMGIEPYKK